MDFIRDSSRITTTTLSRPFVDAFALMTVEVVVVVVKAAALVLVLVLWRLSVYIYSWSSNPSNDHHGCLKAQTKRARTTHVKPTGTDRCDVSNILH